MYRCWWIYRSPQIPACNGETKNAMLKRIRELPVQRSFFFIFKYVELADDVVALFAHANQFGQCRLLRTAARVRLDCLGTHPGNEKRVVADILPDRTLSDERSRRAMDRVGGAHHLIKLLDRPPLRIAQAQEIVSLGEFAQHARYIAGDLRTQPKPAFITIPNCLVEERFERVSLNLHADPHVSSMLENDTVRMQRAQSGTTPPAIAEFFLLEKNFSGIVALQM